MVTTKTTTTEVPEFAQKIRDQWLSAVKQSQQFSVEAAQNFVKAASVLPVADLPTVPGVVDLPSAEAVTKFAFDFAADLLKVQRAFALELANALVPEKTPQSA